MKTIRVIFPLQDGREVTATGRWEADLHAADLVWTGPVEALRAHLAGGFAWPTQISGEDMEALPCYFDDLPAEPRIEAEGEWRRIEL